MITMTKSQLKDIILEVFKEGVEEGRMQVLKENIMRLEKELAKEGCINIDTNPEGRGVCK